MIENLFIPEKFIGYIDPQIEVQYGIRKDYCPPPPIMRRRSGWMLGPLPGAGGGPDGGWLDGGGPLKPPGGPPGGPPLGGNGGRAPPGGPLGGNGGGPVGGEHMLFER